MITSTAQVTAQDLLHQYSQQKEVCQWLGSTRAYIAFDIAFVLYCVGIPYLVVHKLKIPKISCIHYTKKRIG